MLTSIRNVVTKRAIRPGTISTGIRNPMNEVRVRRYVGMKMLMRKGVRLLVMTKLKPLSEKVSLDAVT